MHQFVLKVCEYKECLFNYIKSTLLYEYELIKNENVE